MKMLIRGAMLVSVLLSAGCGGPEAEPVEEPLAETEQRLACTPEGYCPRGSYCDYNTGLCRRIP